MQRTFWRQQELTGVLTVGRVQAVRDQATRSVLPLRVTTSCCFVQVGWDQGQAGELSGYNCPRAGWLPPHRGKGAYCAFKKSGLFFSTEMQDSMGRWAWTWARSLEEMSNVCLSQFPHLYNEGNNSTGPAGMWWGLRPQLIEAPRSGLNTCWQIQFWDWHKYDHVTIMDSSSRCPFQKPVPN